VAEKWAQLLTWFLELLMPQFSFRKHVERSSFYGLVLLLCWKRQPTVKPVLEC